MVQAADTQDRGVQRSVGGIVRWRGPGLRMEEQDQEEEEGGGGRGRTTIRLDFHVFHLHDESRARSGVFGLLDTIKASCRKYEEVKDSLYVL